MKKFLSMVMALALTLSLVTVGASAQDYTDDSSISYNEAVDVISGIGIVNGYTDGSFNPTATLTRGAAAKIICNLMLGATTASALGVNAAPFSDVPVTNVFAGYIAYCSQQGIINGYTDGTFKPAATVTGFQFMKMLLGALGYDSSIEGFTGSNWTVNVATLAIKNDLDNGNDSFIGSKALTREEACLYAFNTMKADLVTYSSKGTTVTINGAEITTGAGDAQQADGDYFYKTYQAKLTTGSPTSDDLGRPATTWFWKGDKIGTYAKSADDSLVVEKLNDVTISGVLTDSDYFNLKSSDLNAPTYTLNGDTVTSSTALQSGDVVEIFKTDSKVTSVAVARYELAKIKTVDTDVTSADAKNDVTCYIDLVDLDGAAVGAGTYKDTAIDGFKSDSFVKNAYIAVALNNSDEIVDSYVATATEGTVSAYTATKNITIAGTKYVLSYNLQNLVSSFAFNDNNYKVYVDANGCVLGIDGVDSVDISDVYYVFGTYFTKAANGSTSYYAQVVSLDGTVSEKVIEATTFADTFNPDSPVVDTFYAVGGLYTFTDKDAVAIGDDNANGDTASVKASSNNDKLSAVVYETGVDSTYYVNVSTLSTALTKSSTSVSLADGSPSKSYLQSDTQFVMIEGTNAGNLDVTMASSSARVDSGKNVITISTKSGSSYIAKYVIVTGSDLSSSVVDTDAVAYLAATSTTEVANGYSATLYFMNGTNQDVTVDDASSIGFFNYSINSKGVYELTSIDDEVYGADADLASNYTYDDGTGFVTGTVNSIFNDSVITLDDKTVSGGGDVIVTDVDLSSDLQIVDSRTTKTGTAYESTINSLSKLEAAMDKGTVSVSMYVDNGDALLIAVTDVAGSGSYAFSATVNGEAAVLYTTADAAATGTTLDVTVGDTLTVDASVSVGADFVSAIDQDYADPFTDDSATTASAVADKVDVIQITVTSEDTTTSHVYYTAVSTVA